MDFQMELFIVLLLVLFGLLFTVWFIRIPVRIAEGRGVRGSSLTTVTILSWCGLFFGITWFIALVMAFALSPDVGTPATKEFDPEKLLQLNELKEKGIITPEEYEHQKQKMLNE